MTLNQQEAVSGDSKASSVVANDTYTARNTMSKSFSKGARVCVLAILIVIFAGGLQKAHAVEDIQTETTTAATDKPPAIVSLGDSYLSGEAGRWMGNSTGHSGTGDYDGTDRAAYLGTARHIPELIYGRTTLSVDPKTGVVEQGCHRSNSAPILSSNIQLIDNKTVEKINLACSGAETHHLLTEGYKNDTVPQITTLKEYAESHDVKLIVVSIGGNDLGFQEIITKCVMRWANPASRLSKSTCADLAEDRIKSFPTVMNSVSNALQSIKDAMTEQGYRLHTDYRLVLESYPSPLPAPDNIRTTDWSRLAAGYPFLDADIAWAHDVLAPKLNSELSNVAEDNDVDFLDLLHACRGHEIGSATSFLAGTGKDRASASNASKMEWFRSITAFGERISQGPRNESMHPNYYGQKAIASCIDLHWKNSQGSSTRVVSQCKNSNTGKMDIFSSAKTSTTKPTDQYSEDGSDSEAMEFAGLVN